MGFFLNILTLNIPVLVSHEKNLHGKLAFLGVLVNNVDGIKTSVYHKPTYTRLLIYKVYLLRTLKYSIFTVNSTWVCLDLGLKKLKYFVMYNKFLTGIIDKY